MVASPFHEHKPPPGLRRLIVSELLTPRLRLRRWQPSDLEPFAAMNADPRVTEFLPTRPDRQATEAMIARAEASFVTSGFGLWAVELRQGGSFAGYVGLLRPSFQAPFTPCVEIGWRLAAEMWGRGYATEGAQAALRHGFEAFALDEILSWTVPANVRSRRIMTKLGMTHDPRDDFDHPLLPEGHPLRRHVLYRIRRSETR
jgi:RimJ/RimL family protein N-acetyltransferase